MTPPSDVYSPYETGLRRLLDQMGKRHPRRSEVLVYQQRLTENIRETRRYGNTVARQSERAEIIDRLSGLAMDVLEVSFNDLCGLEAAQPEGGTRTAGGAGVARMASGEVDPPGSTAVSPAMARRSSEPLPSAPTITWLHLSDLHFRSSRSYDANIVLKALLRDVDERIEQDSLVPEFVAITGDIAFSGKAAEYELARRFFDELLETTGLGRERVFVVPGNHDVDRGLVSFPAMVTGAALTDREKANTILASPENRRLFVARFQGYANFVNGYFPHLPFDDERYFYVRELKLSGVKVAILGLNSAWLCASDEDKAQGLLLGERQVRAVLKEAEDADLKIALLHHPFDHLREFDQGDSAALLLDDCDFVLHGHLHRTAATQLVSPDGAAMVLAGGACYETRRFPNMVNWVRLEPAAGTGTVYLRRYSDERGGFWAKDTLTYKNAPDGHYAFRLGEPIEVEIAPVRPLSAESPVGVDPAPAPADVESYLDCLRGRHCYLSVKGMGVSDRVPLRLPLLELYVPLKARVEMPEGETWHRFKLAGRELAAAATDEESEGLPGRLGEPQPILELLTENDGLIVLGDPGAGKTTFLKYLVLKLAQGEGADLGLEGYLPVLLPLSAYANALSEGDVRLDDFIAGYLHDLGADLPMSEVLGAALREGRALVLLDGLDEVQEAVSRNTVVERVMDFYTYQRRKGNKFVLTSRIVGYREVRPVVEGLVECTLVDFGQEEIEAFVARWTAALERQAQGDTAAARQDAKREERELLQAIQHNAGVRQLAANPLLLTILALMKRQGVTLPNRRVELYDQYVRTLLSSWNRARGLGRAPARDLDVVQTMRILAPLALWMHEVNPGVGLVKREALRRQLVSTYREQGEEEPEAATRRFLGDVRGYAGLLLERGAGQYGFIHLTFEEYLSAVALSQLGQRGEGPVVDYLADRVGEGAWREVSLLAVGYLGIVQQRDEAAGAVLEGLLERGVGELGEVAVLAGEAVLDAWPGGVTAACKEHVQGALVEAMQSREVSPPLRRQSGLVLGRLGWRPADLDEWIEIPPGTFLYGDGKEPCEIADSYRIGKYPVSNVQYARFVEDGGYGRREFWSEVGWGEREQRGWKEPRWWDHPDGNNPIFPVMGVSWYEAEAYCRWLTEVLAGRGELPEGWEVRLPTEKEWERAVRGVDGREYPWGDEFDWKRLSCTDAWVGKEMDYKEWEKWTESIPTFAGTTAVCTYPGGIGPEGLWDGAGNVWEWSLSRWEPGSESRALRGGSWFLNLLRARCSFRFWYDPDLRDYIIGFRVLSSLGS